ncbi:hypothetical protein FVE85_6511 [Porphyridium purpureum]|uniref:Polyphosphate kinase-2-related domain-containing protein n=1 Tax=Porphyridium purpureum TaxID=35688 RepID=A0A5J4Z5D0_PORPP|nr:hypothetical protein FVE85_6511 [Porphyridium purpureum]|eukprot:POR5719..scf295_1
MDSSAAIRLKASEQSRRPRPSHSVPRAGLTRCAFAHKALAKGQARPSASAVRTKRTRLDRLHCALSVGAARQTDDDSTTAGTRVNASLHRNTSTRCNDRHKPTVTNEVQWSLNSVCDSVQRNHLTEKPSNRYADKPIDHAGGVQKLGSVGNAVKGGGGGGGGGGGMMECFGVAAVELGRPARRQQWLCRRRGKSGKGGTICMARNARYTGVDALPEFTAPHPSVEPYRVVCPPGTEQRLDLSSGRYDPSQVTPVADRTEALRVLRENALLAARLQNRLFAEHERSLLLIVHGMHTSGKSTVIKRVLAGLHPAGIHVAHFGVPTQEEREHDFLWRVHAQIPPRGFIGAWVRSHYEDVVTARVQGTVSERELRERFEMINAFERILSLNGMHVVKVLLHISQDEQLARLGLNSVMPLKAWNVKPQDFSRGALWLQYEEAWEDAITRTATEQAPWYVVPSNEKWARNAIVSEILAQNLLLMDPQYPTNPFKAQQLVKRLKKEYVKAGLIGGRRQLMKKEG